MRKLIACTIMSLDGYFEGPGGEVTALPLDHAFDSYNAERLRAADTLLLGRTTYEGFLSFWPRQADDTDPQLLELLAGQDERLATIREISRLNNAIEKVVISDSLTAERTEPWRDTTRIVARAEAHEQVASLKRQPGRDIVVFGSGTLWNDLLGADLVDELHLMIGPVVLAAGTPAFGGAQPASLRLLDTRTFEGSGNLLVRYATAR
jgi:dihydrofolate reductase